MSKIIQRDKSVVPACDVGMEMFEEIVGATIDIESIGGYKVGPALTGRPGYDRIVKVVDGRKPIIFDAQKWSTDVPGTAKSILTPLKESGIGNVILFPESGPVTGYVWIKTAQDLGLGVLVGGEMTHPGYLEGDKLDDEWIEKFKEIGIEEDVTGFIRKDAPDLIYRIAAGLGVTNFVVPGNKPDRILHYKSLIEGCGVSEPVFYAPGFITQGGVIEDGARAAGARFHAIVGGAIYKADNVRKAVLELTSQL